MSWRKCWPRNHPFISSSFEVVQVIHEKLLDMVGKVQWVSPVLMSSAPKTCVIHKCINDNMMFTFPPMQSTNYACGKQEWPTYGTVRPKTHSNCTVSPLYTEDMGQSICQFGLSSLFNLSFFFQAVCSRDAKLNMPDKWDSNINTE